MQDETKHLKWCLEQTRGIRQVKPSENLVRAYLEKSRNALKAMDVNAKADITEWAVAASYYAKYFAVYALLVKIGVKCEIHDCTITLFDYLFGSGATHQLVQELRKSKDDRIETQYYTREIKVNLVQLTSKTKSFVLSVEKILDSLSSEKIRELQSKLKKLITDLGAED